MRLAYFSPLNPQASGIADYSEEILPHLADAGAEVDLFVEGFAPSNRGLRERFRVFDYVRDTSALDRLKDYDAAVYHLGNDHRYHAGIYDAARQHPGVIVFHDFALVDFFRGLAFERNDLDIYLGEVEAEHGRRERELAAEALARGGLPAHTVAPLSFPLNTRLARTAEGIITHWQRAAARFREVAPGTPVAHINHHITAAAAETKIAQRERNTGGPVRIASFGLITPDKGIERILAALAALRDEVNFRYTLVGAPNPFFDVRALIRELGLSDRVEITGHVSLTEFEQRIAETDLAVNLRSRTSGEASGSLCRLMAAGVPTIVSNIGWFADLPDSCVVKVDADECLDAEMRAFIRRLVEDEGLRLRVGANARAHVLAEHRIEQSAAQYISFIEEVVATRARRALLRSASEEVARLGAQPGRDEAFLRTVATEVSMLAPRATLGSNARNAKLHDAAMLKPSETETSIVSNRAALAHEPASGNGVCAKMEDKTSELTHKDMSETDENGARVFDEDDADLHVEGSVNAGRLPKIEGIDYKRAAVEYPQKLDAERYHYLYTKPFYNLANKPPKHMGDGLDPETHRHFCDFANIASALALPAGRRILDVGCGSGWLSEYFARLGYEVTGLDISPELVEIARQRTALVPYDVDHETPMLCRFLVHDVEASPLEESFDAVICYDSLHHFEDERAVLRNISAMTAYGGLLFILEGGKPDAGSATEAELQDVMRLYETLESPFDSEYLRALLNEQGFRIVGDYVSVNGLFERELVEGNRVEFIPENINYILCKKVVRGTGSASSVADSSAPGRLAARLTPQAEMPATVAPATLVRLPLAVENTGDTLWLTGPARRRGACMIGVRVIDSEGRTVSERHGEPPLPRPLAPGERASIEISFRAPAAPGNYRLHIDIVAQHVAWFEQHGSAPLAIQFKVL